MMVDSCFIGCRRVVGQAGDVRVVVILRRHKFGIVRNPYVKNVYRGVHIPVEDKSASFALVRAFG